MALDRQEIIDRLAESEGGQRDLSGLDLSGADLSRMDLRGVNLSRADLSAADLRWAVLEGADLHSTILRRADIRWAVMRGANLRQADLGRANLGWADVSGADLSGADMDGTNVENVDLSASIMERPAYFGGPAARASRGGGMLPAVAGVGAVAVTRTGGVALARPSWVPEGITLPRVTALGVVAVMLGTLALLQVWGWLYRRAYYIDAFKLDGAGIVTFTQIANLWSGLLDVVLLTLKALLTAPLVLIALALLIALLLAPVVLLWFFGERVLADIVRPQMRPVVIGGLFVAFMVIFLLFIIPGLAQIWRWVTANGLPGDEGLQTIFTLFQIGGWITRIGLVLTLALCAVPLWVAWRWFCHWLSTYELPLEWRLRYPALNSAVTNARSARLFERNAPLTDIERRRALGSAAAIVLLLATLLTGAGAVRAYGDMCDGGDLQRLQLYFGEPPANVQTGKLCQRQVAETDDSYYVFFPSQTEETVPGDISSRVPNLSEITKNDEIQPLLVSGSSDYCPTCGGTPNGEEVVVVYPNEQTARGRVTSISGNLALLDVTADQLGTVRVSEATVVTVNGAPATAASIVPGVIIIAHGMVAPDDPRVLDARLVNVLPAGVDGATPAPPAEFNVNMNDPRNLIFNGSQWVPASNVEVRLIRLVPGQTATADTPGVPLTTITVGPDGTFSSPQAYREGMPTGPDYATLAVDAASGQVAQGPWLSLPPPTLTPVPTIPSQPTSEATLTPEGGAATPEGGEATPTPTGESGEATNTAFPTMLLPGGAGGAADCEKDPFEYDNTRGFQKEIYVSITEPDPQEHNFCPRGDIDLIFFQVKQGKWYKVTTSGLANGVDTVMAVGDLSNSTPCFPAGCWNDDAGALTLASEITFQAVSDATALITVDNRGTNYSTEATYQLSVVNFQPEPTPTVTMVPTATSTPTRTATATRLPARDPYEANDTCRTATESPLLMVTIDEPKYATLATLTQTDEDWYVTVTLEPGNYKLKMIPPEGQDYDMDLRLNDNTASTRRCPFFLSDYQDGDNYEEIRWAVTQPTSYIVKVYPRPGSRSGDPSEFYSIQLTSYGPTPPPTLTPVPPPTPMTPTATPPLPISTPTAILPQLP
jgi:hypothetical protein